jgi:replicative DNA helicase
VSLELENKVVGASLYDPSLFMRYDLETEWIFDKQNKVLVDTLSQTDGKYTDFSELLVKIKEIDPYTSWTEDSLELLSFRFHELDNYEQGIKLLQRRFFEEKIRQANERYLNQPSKQNLLSLQDRIRELEETQKSGDDGSLESAVKTFLNSLEIESEEGIRSFEKLDRVIGDGMRGGMLITIGARPSVGKTAYVINLASQMLDKQTNMAVDIFTLEMSKKQMLDRFISLKANINSYKLRKPNERLKEDEKDRTAKMAQGLSRTGLKVYDSLYKLRQIEKQIRRRVHEHGSKNYVAIVDYIGLIETDNSRMDRHLQVGEITRTFKKLTNDLDVPIIMLSQLNRAVESRQDKVPNLSDLRESGSVEQDSNVVGFLYRDPEDENVVKLNIAKNREGITFTLSYRFVGSSMYFEELD